MRPTDADALTSDQIRLMGILSNPVYWGEPLDSAIDYLLESDVTSVIRCWRCKFWHRETGWCDHHSYFIDSEGGPCRPDESCDWKMFDENYFCADGKARDENAESEADVDPETMHQMFSSANHMDYVSRDCWE